MNNILVLNSGSTSLKYKLFDVKEKELKAGEIVDIKNHEDGVKKVLKEIGGLQDLAAVGHRVVHGGDKFHEPIVIDEKKLGELEGFNDLAPLHNPYNLAGIRAVSGFLPDITQVAVFDTAFYFDLPEVARIYALPKKLAEELKIKRYGFHGISHRYAMEVAAKALTPACPAGRPGPSPIRGEGSKARVNKKFNLITCHLGGGWSVTAIKNGKPVDTSMGWTPLEGLVMMTRSGDLDPGIVVELLKHREVEENISTIKDLASITEDIYHLLNYESGIKGLTGVNDFQELLKRVSLGNREAKSAFDLAIYRLVKYIGAYFAVLEGKIDAIVFTGAIGAGNPMTRLEVMRKSKFLGKIPVIVVKANEELAIAREVGKLLSL